MKARTYYLGVMIAVLWGLSLRASASGLGDIRVNARFLTDKMAFELNLMPTQYDDLFEVNYDFLSSIDPYVGALARQDAYALERYYRYLDERNDDLRWILSNAEFIRFMGMDYFFRPVYIVGNNLCALRVYNRYPDRHVFYFDRPKHYHSYCGAHSRPRHRGISYYQRNYKTRYRHPVFNGNFRQKPERPLKQTPHRFGENSGKFFSSPDRGRKQPADRMESRPNRRPSPPAETRPKTRQEPRTERRERETRKPEFNSSRRGTQKDSGAKRENNGRRTNDSRQRYLRSM